MLEKGIHNDMDKMGYYHSYFSICSIWKEVFNKMTKYIWEKREYKLVKKLPKFTYHRLESKTER